MNPTPTSTPAEDLRQVRQLMERGALFRHLSATGLILAGCLALLAGWYVHWQLAVALANPGAWPQDRLNLPLTLVPVLAFIAMVGSVVLLSRAQARRQGTGLVLGATVVVDFLRPFVLGVTLMVGMGWWGGAPWVLPTLMLLFYLGLSNVARHFPPPEADALGWATFYVGFLGVMGTLFAHDNLLGQVRVATLLFAGVPLLLGCYLLWVRRRAQPKPARPEAAN